MTKTTVDASGPDFDQAAHIIGDLLALMDEWQLKNLNTAETALQWLKANDRHDRWLNAKTRWMMDGLAE